MPDYFAVLGVARTLRLDASDLERRYRQLSRECHPDYFHNAPPAERRASLERSSSLNAAYRTLRDTAARIAHLLEVEGVAARESPNGNGGAPASLLEEVFALNEELDEARRLRATGAPEPEWRARIERARRPIEARRVEHESDLDALSARWDELAGAADTDRQQVLAALRDRLLERNYITNLLADVERMLDDVG